MAHEYAEKHYSEELKSEYYSYIASGLSEKEAREIIEVYEAENFKNDYDCNYDCDENLEL